MRDKKRQRKVLLVGKQLISYTHLCSLLVGGNFKFIMLGQFYWSITTKGGWRGVGVKTWVGNFVVGQKNKWFKWHSSKVTQSWSHGVGCQNSMDYTIGKSTHVTMNSWGLWASRLFMCAQARYRTIIHCMECKAYGLWNTKENELRGLDDHQLWAC